MGWEKFRQTLTPLIPSGFRFRISVVIARCDRGPDDRAEVSEVVGAFITSSASTETRRRRWR